MLDRQSTRTSVSTSISIPPARAASASATTASPSSTICRTDGEPGRRQRLGKGSPCAVFSTPTFCSPLPARSGFEENDDDRLARSARQVPADARSGARWPSRHAPGTAGVQDWRPGATHRSRHSRSRRVSRFGAARGMAKRGRPEPTTTRATAPGRDNAPAERRAAENTRPGILGPRPAHPVRRRPFEAGSTAHSRFIAGVVQSNTLHQDFSKRRGRATHASRTPP